MWEGPRLFTMVFEAAASGRNRCQDILDDVQLALDREQERLDREERDSDFRWFETKFALDREQERVARELLRLDAAGLVAGALRTGQALPQLDAARLSSVLENNIDPGKSISLPRSAEC